MCNSGAGDGSCKLGGCVSRFVRNAIFILVLVSLGSCAQIRDTGLPTDEKPPGSDLVTVALQFPAGLPVLKKIEVRYWNAEVAAPQSAVGSGSDEEHFVELIPGEQTDLSISEGDYMFETRGFGGDSDTLMAFGRNTATIGPDTESLDLGLQAILGSAELLPLMPRNNVVPGDELGYGLHVRATDSSVLLPAEAYEVTYQVGSGAGVEMFNPDANGVTVRLPENLTGEFQLTALISGLVLVDDVPTSDQQLTVRNVLSVATARQLEEDWQEPELAFDPIDPVLKLLTGTATDNRGIDSVRVFHGSVLLGSSNLADRAGVANVAEVVFTDAATGAWELSWAAKAGASYTLRAEATDISGNMTPAFQSLNVRPPASTDGLTEYRTVSSSMGKDTSPDETFADLTSDTCAASEFSLPGQGLQAVGAGLQAVGAIGGLFLAPTTEFTGSLTNAEKVGWALRTIVSPMHDDESILTLMQQDEIVVLLIVDDFGSGESAALPPQELLKGLMTAAEIRDAVQAGIVPHGSLVLWHTLELFRGAGYELATSSVPDAPLEQTIELTARDSQQVAFILHPVNTNGLTSAGIADLIGEYYGNHAPFYGDQTLSMQYMPQRKNFVVNMSFVMIPCGVQDDLQATGIRSFEDYVAAVAAVNGTGVDEASAVTQKLLPDDPLLQFIKCPWILEIGTGDCPELSPYFGSLVHVASSGNFGLDFPLFPAAADNVIAVGSQNAEGSGFSYESSSFSNLANVLAPGAMYELATAEGGTTIAYAGTSFSAPVLSVFTALDLASAKRCDPGEFTASGFEPPALALADTELKNIPLHSVFGNNRSAVDEVCNGPAFN